MTDTIITADADYAPTTTRSPNHSAARWNTSPRWPWPFGDNVSDNAALDKAFLDSIKQHGVLVPVTVRNGQRRTLAAREVGLTTIPASFLDHLETDRHNSARSRNARLAALRSLFRYAP